MHALGKRYGSAFTVKLPFFGATVIISDPALVKQFFQTRTDVVRNVEPNLDMVLGPGSTFGLQDEEHRRRRKLLVPPFHGKRMRAYENLRRGGNAQGDRHLARRSRVRGAAVDEPRSP